MCMLQPVVIEFANASNSSRVAKKSQALESAKVTTQRKASMQNFYARPMQQQQAALNLARFAQRETDIGLGEGKVDALILSLTVRLLCHLPHFRSSALTYVKQSEAPLEVTTAIDNASPPSVVKDEREQLLKLQELIARRLKA
jgi:hypothetical protein